MNPKPTGSIYRVTGHGLQGEGAAFFRRANGTYERTDTMITGGPGFGVCACGATTDNPVASRRARRAWHKTHLEELS